MRVDEPTPSALLQVSNVSKHFGGLVALEDVDFVVSQDTGIIGVIGPNGAGKSTLFDVICGLQPATSGKVFLDGHEVRTDNAHAIARMGLARTFQNFRLLEDATCLENVLAGTLRWTKAGFAAAGSWSRGSIREEGEAIAAAEEALEFVGLADRRNQPVGSLPAGVRRQVEIARARAGHARVYMLDEPAGGLNDYECGQLEELLRRLTADNTLIILVEHRVPLVMKLADRVIALDRGRIIGDDRPQAIRENRKVIDAYLGTDDA